MVLSTLHDLFIHELKDLYSAERQLTKALPRMSRAASSDTLRSALDEHLEETRAQIVRLEEMLTSLDASTRGSKCVAMEGLIEEGAKTLAEDAEPAVKDAALIAAAQKIEHYEIAGYGTVLTYARMLGLSEAEGLLHQSLQEEKETDHKLTDLAESEINVAAQR